MIALPFGGCEVLAGVRAEDRAASAVRHVARVSSILNEFSFPLFLLTGGSDPVEIGLGFR